MIAVIKIQNTTVTLNKQNFLLMQFIKSMHDKHLRIYCVPMKKKKKKETLSNYFEDQL